MKSSVKRGFVDIAEGQMLYRYAGLDKKAPPLIMLHVVPGTSLGLVPLMELISQSRPVYAPDMLGCGDSCAPNSACADIAYFGNSVLRFADAMKVDTFDLYGNRVGCHAALETAVAAPKRVRRLIADGLFLFPWPRDVLERKTANPEPELDRLKALYAPAIPLDVEGSQFHRALMANRDSYLFWPWYERNEASRRTIGLPSADDLHDKTLEFLRGIRTQNIINRASFSQDWRARSALVSVPTLAEGNVVPFIPEAQKKASSRFDAFATTPEKTTANARDILAFLETA